MSTTNITITDCSIKGCLFNSLACSGGYLSMNRSVVSFNNGGMQLNGFSQITIDGSRIEGNKAEDAIVNMYSSNLTVKNSKFYKNELTSSTSGSVIASFSCGGTVNVSNSIFAANKNIKSAVIYNGLICSDCNACTLYSNIDHVTMVDNQLAPTANDVYAYVGHNSGEKAVIRNSILWDVATNPLYCDLNTDVQNTTIRNGISGIRCSGNKDVVFSTAPNKVYSFQPEFIAQGDYRPATSSKAIDAGIPIAGLTTDIDGAARDSKPDLGAYEKGYTGSTTVSLPIQDATISNAGGCGSGDQGNNFGTYATITASHNAGSICVNTSDQKTLIKFDLSNIPPNAMIVKATFKMVAIANNAITSRMRKVMASAWNENSVTWTSQPTSYSTTELIPVPLSTSGNTASIDVTRFVTFWYRNPDLNFGMLYELDPTINTTVSNNFGSKDNSTASLRPVFTVEYVVPTNPGVIIVNEDAMISNFNATGGYTELTKNYVNNNNELVFEPAQPNATSIKVRRSLMTWNTKPTATYNSAISGIIPAQTSGTANKDNPVYVDVTAIVNAWLASPTRNLGMEIRLQNEVPTTLTQMIFASMEYDDPAYHPRLLLEYDMNGWTGTIKSEEEAQDVATTEEATGITVVNAENTTVKIYPVPTHDIVVIEATNLEESIQFVEITDMLGKTVAKITPSEQIIRLDVSAFADGVYIVKIATNKDIVSGRFVKN